MACVWLTMGHSRYLFVPFSVFTVVSVHWSATANDIDPHVVTLAVRGCVRDGSAASFIFSQTRVLMRNISL